MIARKGFGLELDSPEHCKDLMEGLVVKTFHRLIKECNAIRLNHPEKSILVLTGNINSALNEKFSFACSFMKFKTALEEDYCTDSEDVKERLDKESEEDIICIKLESDCEGADEIPEEFDQDSHRVRNPLRTNPFFENFEHLDDSSIQTPFFTRSRRRDIA
eukprot:TRINITY_DN8088_c0_g1_i4.p1 TRINITY_DN8088_c0_g1~~TRINITY_DN8088_c0_g1_i4.p1  ORF type:complete len:161 (-),score=31.59 TRINITY_DN8088_c0_g1_i4:129-611(-)